MDLYNQDDRVFHSRLGHGSVLRNFRVDGDRFTLVRFDTVPYGCETSVYGVRDIDLQPGS